MKKILITLMLALTCILLLAVSASAKEYNVASNDEYQAAFESAANGDTIIINGNLSCDIQGTKSITYILKANWESSRFVISSNVEVSFIADGGNYKIMPTGFSATDGWMSVSEIYEGVVINLGGKGGGTVTIDGTNATHDRVCYVTATNTADITWNFYDGSALANFNAQTADTNENAFIIYSRTINMYSGSKIYANRVVGAPLMRATYFNLYGGEIFGNVLQSTRTYSKGSGAIFVSERLMVYGGRIYKNILNSKTSSQINMVGFFTTPLQKYVVILDVSIGDNYATGNGSNEISALFGTNVNQSTNTYFYCNSNMQKGTRYTFTGTPELSYDAETGKTIWQVGTYAVQSTGWTGRGWTRTEKSGDKVVAFLNASKENIAGITVDNYTLINAYIEGVYSYSGSTTAAIPSGYTLWSTSGSEYCHSGETLTIDEIRASMPVILYTAYENSITEEAGNTMCSICGKSFVCEDDEHVKNVTITYTSYDKVGTKVSFCTVCNTVSTTEAQALFTCLGYSAPNDGRNGLAIGYKVNGTALAEYEATGKVIKYGVFAVVQERLGTNDIFASNGAASTGVLNAEISAYSIVSFTLRIVGFTQEYRDLKLAMGAYVAEINDEDITYSYIQAGTPKGQDKYCFISYNEVANGSI